MQICFKLVTDYLVTNTIKDGKRDGHESLLPKTQISEHNLIRTYRYISCLEATEGTF